MKLFKTEEEKVKIILTKHYPELYNLTKEEIAQIKNNLNNIDWDALEKELCSISLDWDFKWGKRYVLFSDLNRNEYDVINVVRYEHYDDGVTIDGIKKPTLGYKFALIVQGNRVFYRFYLQFNSMDEIHQFIWGD